MKALKLIKYTGLIIKVVKAVIVIVRYWLERQ